MKQFFLRISIFLLIVFVGAWAIDFVISYRLRHNENRMYAAWNDIYQDSLKYDLVVNGGSCACRHYSTFIIDSIMSLNSYNLGIQGSSINRQIIKYNKYCELRGTPSYLIQNIDLGTMNIVTGFEREQFFSYFFFDRNLINQINQYEHFTFAEKYIPCYRYLGYDDVILEALLNDNTKHYIELPIKGYSPIEKSCWDGSTLKQMDSIVFSCDTTALALFIDFVEQETQKGTKILFVYSPIYYEARQKMVNEQQMFEMYDSIAKKFDIPILDYNDIPMCYDTTYFYNATHLNRIGAELFTTKLAHDIDSLGLLK